MVNYLAPFFIILISMPWLMQSMDDPKTIFIEDRPFGKLMRITNIKQIAFLGNHEIVLNREFKQSLLIDIISSQAYGFLSVPFRGGLTTDQLKKRALFSCYDSSYMGHSIKMRIYDSQEKTLVGSTIYLDYDGRGWPICFDERNNKPDCVLVEKGKPSSIISYNYRTEKIDPELFISKIFSNDQLRSHQYLFDPLSSLSAIVSAGKGKFIIDYQSQPPSSQEYPITSHSLDRNYICNSDLSFIGHYSHIAEDSIRSVGHDGQGYRAALIFMSGCCITNIATGSTIYLNDENKSLVAPCSLEFHPNNKVMVTMSAGDRVIEYWQAATGQLLARQEFPDRYKGDFMNDVGTFCQYLSFSADGTLLAVALTKACVICNVPYFISNETKLIFILWCLNNYRKENHNNALPKDILNLLFAALKQ